MKTLRLNKKGDFGVIDFFLYLALIALLFIFFFAIAKFLSNKVAINIDSQISNNEAQGVLITYLRTPVIVQGEKMDIAELIARGTLDDKYRKVAESELKKVLAPPSADATKENFCQYELMVVFPSGNSPDPSNTYYIGDDIFFDRQQVAQTMIPNQNGEIIEISLFIAQTIDDINKIK